MTLSNKNNEKLITGLIILTWICIALLLNLSIGCGSMPWQKKAVVSYQSFGATLQTAKQTLFLSCSNGTLNSEDCKQAKAKYNEAVNVYKLMGNKIIILLDTDDEIIYQTMSFELLDLLSQLSVFTERNNE